MILCEESSKSLKECLHKFTFQDSEGVKVPGEVLKVKVTVSLPN